MQGELTMAEAAMLLCLDSPRTYQRYETGENRPDAPMVERIRAVSHGRVTIFDLHVQRLDWLRLNRPEAFAAMPSAIKSPEVAE